MNAVDKSQVTTREPRTRRPGPYADGGDAIVRWKMIFKHMYCAVCMIDRASRAERLWAEQARERGAGQREGLVPPEPRHEQDAQVAMAGN